MLWATAKTSAQRLATSGNKAELCEGGFCEAAQNVLAFGLDCLGVGKCTFWRP